MQKLKHYTIILDQNLVDSVTDKGLLEPYKTRNNSNGLTNFVRQKLLELNKKGVK